MTETAKTEARAFLTVLSESDTFKQFVLLCAAILFVFLISLTEGLDLSPGFF